MYKLYPLFTYLKVTLERFNRFVEKGIDEDFGRGNFAYGNYYGNPTYKKPNLGAIVKTHN